MPVHVFGRLLDDHVDDVVVRDDADEPAVVVHHRHGQEVVAGAVPWPPSRGRRWPAGSADSSSIMSRIGVLRRGEDQSRSDTTPSSFRLGSSRT